jgi:hypothetical protein
MVKKKNEKKCHFPTDPRYDMRISPAPNLQALGDDHQMLNTQLLDCLLQHSAPPPNGDTPPYQVYLGSLGTRSYYLENCNTSVDVDRGPFAPSNWNRIIQAKIKGIRSTFDPLFSDVIIDDDATSKSLIIPIVYALYFFVLVLEFNFKGAVPIHLRAGIQ